MNRLVITSVVLSAILLCGIPSQVLALSPAQLKTCLDKMPKNLTNAQKTVYKKNCNSQERTFGKVPPGFKSTPKFGEADLIALCISLKLTPKAAQNSQFQQIVKLSKINGHYKYCEIMWKDKIWSGKKATKNDALAILKYYGKSLGAFQ